ncbi:hypothetical protein ACJX0J_004141, partial (mitochondrion) [Zea mays]
ISREKTPHIYIYNRKMKGLFLFGQSILFRNYRIVTVVFLLRINSPISGMTRLCMPILDFLLPLPRKHERIYAGDVSLCRFDWVLVYGSVGTVLEVYSSLLDKYWELVQVQLPSGITA